MLRISVQRLLLQLRMMFRSAENHLQSDNSLLFACMDPPLIESVLVAENELIDLGAFEKQENQCKITWLGQHLANLPCDPSIGKMLIYGTLLHCISTISAIAACVTLKDPFIPSNDPEILNKVAISKSL